MRYYKVKPEYDQTCKNPRIHNGNILIGASFIRNQNELKCDSCPISVSMSWISRATKLDLCSAQDLYLESKSGRK